MSASQVPVAIASSVSPATAAQAPSSCSGPRSCVNVCSGWSEKRRAWGASAASGVPPLVCATHGPGSIPSATAAMARSGTHRRTRSPSVGVDLDAALAQSRAHRAPDAPTRPDDNHSVDQSVLQFRSDTGLFDECNAERCRLLPALESSMKRSAYVSLATGLAPVDRRTAPPASSRRSSETGLAGSRSATRRV